MPTARPERDAGGRVLIVESGEAGTRLDAFLAAQLGVSRAEARRLLARGAVVVAERRVGARHKGTPVAGGMRVEVEPFLPPRQRRAIAQPELPLRVLARGPGWLALDKPAGWPVHPLEEGERGTLLNALASRNPEVQGVGEGGLRSGVVHRLDVDTSGIVLFASDDATWQRLRRAFATGRVEKLYRAVVLGGLEGEGSETLDLALARHRPARVRVEARARRDARTRRARLRWRALERLAGATLVEVCPRTGFLHQIRVTLAHLGHPVAGDRTYGPPAAEDATGATRQMLHAARIAVDEIVAESAEPPDFAALLARLRLPGGS